jgi:hypothetical protein
MLNLVVHKVAATRQVVRPKHDPFQMLSAFYAQSTVTASIFVLEAAQNFIIIKKKNREIQKHEDSHLHRVSRLRMHGTLPLFLHTS